MATTRAKPNFSIPTEAWLKRQAIWRHNSFTGYARMTYANMSAILKSSTATDDAKRIANQIAVLTLQLENALKERCDGQS